MEGVSIDIILRRGFGKGLVRVGEGSATSLLHIQILNLCHLAWWQGRVKKL